MTYADYKYYTEKYLGTAIQEADFPRLALRASMYLDYYTQNKAQDHIELDAIKMACCALAEQYQIIDTAQALANKSLTSSVASAEANELQSQTVGSWTKSFRSGGDSAASAISALNEAKGQLNRIVQENLAATGLLYRVRRCFK